VGDINLYSCNGVDDADWWGVFGQNPAATDGFQNDFPALGIDFADVKMYGCNVEAFKVCGVYIQNLYKKVEIIGGKFDRVAYSTAYNSMLRLAQAAIVAGNPIILSLSNLLKGTGVPNGGAGLTNAWIYAAAGQPTLLDLNGVLSNAVTGYYSATFGGLVPICRQAVSQDVYQDTAVQFTAISPRRFSAQTVRYMTTTLTPVGAGQSIDVTGFTKVIVTPAAAASITTAVFSSGIGSGTGTDWARNGDLIIEAGNANLTINHTARGGAANTFILTGGANLTLASGQIVQFLRSETGSQWQQV
jgi:hypothetical protein